MSKTKTDYKNTIFYSLNTPKYEPVLISQLALGLGLLQLLLD